MAYERYLSLILVWVLVFGTFTTIFVQNSTSGRKPDSFKTEDKTFPRNKNDGLNKGVSAGPYSILLSYQDSNPNTQFYLDNQSSSATGAGSEIKGELRDFDEDGDLDLSFVDSNGNIEIVDIDGDNRQIVSTSAPESHSKLATGDLDKNGVSEIYWPNTSDNNYIYKVEYGGSPTRVTDISNSAANAIVGVTDYNQDGDKDIVFVGTSNTIKWLDNGTVMSTGNSNIGSNNNLGIGSVGDFDHDGNPRVAFVGGSRDVQLLDEDGTTTSLSSANAAKAPVGAVNVTGDDTLEIVYASNSGKLKYVTLTDTTGSLTDTNGNDIDLTKAAGVTSRGIMLTYGVNVTAPADQIETVKNNTYSYNFTVENIGSSNDTYDLNISSSNNVTFQVSGPSQVNVPAGGSIDVTVDVKISNDVTVGNQTAIAMRAVSQNETTVSDREAMNLTYENCGVDVSAPEDQMEISKGIFTYQFWVNNTGTFKDTYNLTPTSSDPNFSVLNCPDLVTVSPGNGRLVSVDVNIRAGASSGDQSIITLNATSQNSSASSVDYSPDAMESVHTEQDWEEGGFAGTSVDRQDRSGNLGIGYRDGPPGEGLIGYWRFDEFVSGSGSPVKDYSGENNAGVTVNGVTTGADGVEGTTAFNFDGADDFVNVSASPSLNRLGSSGYNNYSVSMWMHREDNGTYDHLISNLGPRAPSGPCPFEIWMPPESGGTEELQVAIKDTNYNSVVVERDTFVGEWFHIAFTRQEDKLNVFVNGEKEESTTFTSLGDTSNNQPLLIGQRGDNAIWFNGSLDETLIYNRTLSDDEVKNIYQHGGGLVSHYRMDRDIRGTLGRVKDYSGNDNTGTTRNGVTSDVNGTFSTKGFEFDGNDDYVEVPSDQINNGPFAVSLWFKPDSSDWNGTLFDATNGDNSGSQDQVFYVTVEQNQINWIYEDSSDSNSELTLNADLSQQKWYHLVATGVYNGDGYQSLYLNGERIGFESRTAFGQKPDMNSFYIGNYTYSYSFYLNKEHFDGKIDEFQIYSQNLTAEEVEELYHRQGLVGMWKMDDSSVSGDGGTVVDHSASDNDGTAFNGIDTDSPGVFSTNGFEFDGVDDHIAIPDDGSLDIAGATTMQAWIKPNVAHETGPNLGVMAKADSGVGWSWQLRFGNNAANDTLGFKFNTNVGDRWVNIGQNLTPDEWYHVVGVFNGSHAKMYLNGELKDITTFGSIITSDAELVIGEEGWDLYFNGTIDEVRIYNRSLSKPEIMDLYSQGKHSGDYESKIFNIPENEALSKIRVNSTNINSENETWVNVSTSRGAYDLIKLDSGSNDKNYSLDIPQTGGGATVTFTLTSGHPTTTPVIGDFTLYSAPHCSDEDSMVVSYENYSVNVSAPPDQQETSYNSYNYTFNITNSGTHNETFDLLATSNDGDFLIVDFPMWASVPAGSSKEVNVTIDISGAPLGDSAIITLNASSQNFSVSDEDSMRVTYGRYNVSVEAPPNRTVTATGVHSFLFTVNNTGSLNETFELNATTNNTWNVSVEPSSVYLTRGEHSSVYVNVTVPSGVSANESCRVSLKASSFNGNASDKNHTILTYQGSGVDVIPPGDQIITQDGFTTQYEFRLNNTGSIDDTYNLSAFTSNSSWFASSVVPSITIPAGGTRRVNVSVTIPSGLSPGDFCLVYLNGTSQNWTAYDNDTMRITYDEYGVNVTNQTEFDMVTQPIIHTYYFWVNNTGSLNDTYELNATSDDPHFTIASYPDNISLEPGGSTSVPVDIEVWSSVTPGDTANITLNATSQNKTMTYDQDAMTILYEEYNVSVTAPPDQDEIGAGSYTYQFWVNNTGSLNDSYDLSVDCTNSDWSVSLNSYSIHLNASESRLLDVTITIPDSSPGGITETITLNATSQSGTEVYDEDSMNLTYDEYGVDVSGPSNKAGTGTGNYSYNFTVTNTGSLSDTYNVSLSSSNTDWPAEILANSTVSLSPGASANIPINVTVPTSVSPGNFTDITVDASSENSSKIDNHTMRITFGDFDVKVTGPNDDTVYSTGPHSYQYTVENTGSMNDTFDLLATTNNSWSASAQTSNISLPSGASQQITVSVNIPTSAQGDTIGSITLQAVSQNSSISDSDSMNLTYEEYNVSVTAPNDQTVTSNDTFTYQFWINNTGSLDDTYDLIADSSDASWTVNVQDNMTVPSGDNVSVDVDVTVPDGLTVGSTTVITLNADSQSWSVSDSDSMELTYEEYNVSVTAPPDQQEVSTGTYTYQFNVENTGSLNDTYHLTYTITNTSWSVSLGSSYISLPAGADTSIDVSVTIPSGAVPGDSVSLTLTASSMNDSDISDMDSMMINYGSYEVNVTTPADTVETATGQFTYQFWVNNTGTLNETYNLTVTVSVSNWSAAVQSVVTLSSNRSMLVDVQVTIPSSVSAGDSCTITLNATSQNGTATAEDSMVILYENYSHTVDAPEDKTEFNQAQYTYHFWLNNTGSLNDTYNITLASDNNDFVVDGPTQVTVAAGNSKQIEITVTIEGSATLGEEVTITIIAESQNSSEEIQDSFLVSYEGYGVQVSAPADSTETSTGTYTYNFTVENTGTLPDTYSLTATSDNGNFAVSVTEQISLTAGSSSTVEVEVTISSQASPGEVANIELNATSQNSTEYSLDSMTITYTEDTEAPQSQADPDGSLPEYENEESFKVYFEASDDQKLQEINLYYRIDDGNWKHWSTVQISGTSTSGTFDFTASEDGTYSFYTVANDSAGNSEDVPENPDAEVVVDTEAPMLSITSPTDGAVMNTEDVEVVWTGSDNTSGILTYELMRDDQDWIEKGLNTQHMLNNLTEGEHIIKVRATDRAGNQKTVELQFEVVTVEATVSITSPEEGAVLNHSSVTVEWTSENTDYHEVRIDDRSWVDVGTKKTHTFESVDDGDHTIQVKGVYGENSTLLSAFSSLEASSETDSISFTVDTEGPTINIISPSDGDTFDTESVMAEWDGSDQVSGIDHYEIRINNGEWQTVGGDLNHTFSDLQKSTHTVHVRAVDEAGNVAEDSVEFEVTGGKGGQSGILGENCLFGLLAVIIAIIVALILLMGWYRKEIDVIVSAPEPQRVDSPGPSYYQFALENPGDADETYYLTAETSNKEWTVSVPGEISVPEGSTDRVEVQVDIPEIPEDVEGSASSEITLMATSQSDEDIFDSDTMHMDYELPEKEEVSEEETVSEDIETTEGAEEEEPEVVTAEEEIKAPEEAESGEGAPEEETTEEVPEEPETKETEEVIEVEEEISEETIEEEIGPEKGAAAGVGEVVAGEEESSPPKAEAGKGRTVKVGEAITFNGSKSTDEEGIVGYEWYFDEFETAFGEEIEHTFEEPGIHTVKLVVTNESGLSDEDEIEVTVEQSEEEVSEKEGREEKPKEEMEEAKEETEEEVTEEKTVEEEPMEEEGTAEEEVLGKPSKEEVLEEFQQFKGIGSAMAERLYDGGFESLEELKNASPEDLEEVKGIGSSLSSKLYERMHEDD